MSVWLLVLCMLGVAVFAVQNHEPVELSFLHWSVVTSTALALLIACAVGLAIGWTLGVWRGRRRVRRREEDEVERRGNRGGVAGRHG